MSAMQPLALGPDELGECARWVEADRELWRVDIVAGCAYRARNPTAAAPEVRRESFEGEVGFAIPRRGGGAVVGVERELWLVDDDGGRHQLLELDERPENRFNDAVCDQQGRLWAGTFARDRRQGAANLYRIDPDGATELVLSGLTISNGIGWLDDGATLHFIDSPTQRLEAFDVEIDAGRLGGRRTLAEVDAADGSPDGLCIDAEDCTWVALFGGGEVRRYDRSGRQVGRLAVPVPHPTSPCLGGERGTELFVTTTRHRLELVERERWPLAGHVFLAEVGVLAQPLLSFGG
ncbi:MAG: SMP-30/gluconolactonase/LRE family protein [Actinobacteria bacterium]|nr:SMP-30/gluconolactonase/LRE family protein [Actinomycetota bacterium]